MIEGKPERGEEKVIDLKDRLRRKRNPGKYLETGYELVSTADHSELDSAEALVLIPRPDRCRKKTEKRTSEGGKEGRMRNMTGRRMASPRVPPVVTGGEGYMDNVDTIMRNYRLRRLRRDEREREMRRFRIKLIGTITLLLLLVLLTCRLVFAEEEQILPLERSVVSGSEVQEALVKPFLPENSERLIDMEDPYAGTALPLVAELRVDVVKQTRNDRDLGEFEITAYDRTECLGADGTLNKTFTETTPKANHTVAVDPKVIPLGSRLEIDGVVYTAEDTGGKVKGRVIDIYFDSHEETEAFGRQKKRVYLLAG